MKLFQTNNMDIIKSCQSYLSFQLLSAVLSKRVAKFNMKFKNHLISCVGWLTICEAVVMCKYSRKSCHYCVTLIHCLVEFIVWYVVFFLFPIFLPVVWWIKMNIDLQLYKIFKITQVTFLGHSAYMRVCMYETVLAKQLYTPRHHL